MVTTKRQQSTATALGRGLFNSDANETRHRQQGLPGLGAEVWRSSAGRVLATVALAALLLGATAGLLLGGASTPGLHLRAATRLLTTGAPASPAWRSRLSGPLAGLASQPASLLTELGQPVDNAHTTALQSSSDSGAAAGSAAESQAAVGAAQRDDQLPWQQQVAPQQVCSDTCASARDGTCQDGRGAADALDSLPVTVLCDLGTDCADCGPWTFHLPPGSAPAQPIQQLLANQVEVRVRRTATRPAFLMPYTDPTKDVDVSAQVEAGGAVELGLTQLWQRRLAGRCARAELVADVGGNFGWYALFAASMGCRVVTWEPVPQFRAFLEYGVQLNNLTHLVDIRDRVVAEEGSSREYDMVVPQRGIWGTAGIDGLNIDPSVDNQGALQRLRLAGERVDAALAQPLALLKLDVEGFEPGALASARRLFDNFRVENVVLEYSPGILERANRWDSLLDMPQMLIFLLERGFTLLHVDDGVSHGQLTGPAWDAAPPPLAAITAANLAHDVRDCAALANRSLGCPLPPELVQFDGWGGCNFLPEDLSPYSFHGTFGHNTNVWAALSTDDLLVGPPVGIKSPDQPSNDYFGSDPDVGMGGRRCQYLEARNQVRHRCRCRQAEVCGQEEAAVTALAQAGRLARSQLATAAETT